MNDCDYKTYKTSSIILAWDNDFYSHIDEIKKWKSALVSNAHKNHQEDRLQALLNVNLERNPMKLWRPWYRCDDMSKILQSATDSEYKDILKDLIFNRGAPPQKIEKKKRIVLEKKQREKEEIDSWIKLVEPEDEINLV